MPLTRYLPDALPPSHAIWLAALAVSFDFLAGPLVQFPATFIVPVAFASWYGGVLWGLPLSIALPLFRVSNVLMWHAPWGLAETLINGTIRMATFSLLTVLIAAAAAQQRQLRRDVRVLKGLLPICGECKQIRDERGNWHDVESYVAGHSDAEFSHGLCPVCLSRELASVEAYREHLARHASPAAVPLA